MMTLEEYIEEKRKRVANMTLSQARDLIAKTLSHSDMEIEFDKAVWMLLDCADEKINDASIKALEQEPKKGEWIEHKTKNGTVVAYTCPFCKKSPKKGIKSDFCPNCGSDLRGECMIKVGDEIYSKLTNSKGVVHRIDTWHRYQCFNEIGAQFVLEETTFNKYWVKTGKHYPQIVEVLKQMNESS